MNAQSMNSARSTCYAAVPLEVSDSYPIQMNIEFSGEIWFWKGPAPHHFVTVPDQESRELGATSALVSYGWGMIPVTVQMGGSRWTTALFPKDGRYIVPLKARVRKAEAVDVGDTVELQLTVNF